MPLLNIEIKARCHDHTKIREMLKRHSADYIGTDHQIDTYFEAKYGRLKLREGKIENYLIHYNREDKLGPKQSDIILFKTYPGSELKVLLTTALGILVVIDKEREIYFIDNVKFHIDNVKGLGAFIEIEAIDKNGDLGKEKLLAQCNLYLDLFDISEADLISGSYSDLLLGK